MPLLVSVRRVGPVLPRTTPYTHVSLASDPGEYLPQADQEAQHDRHLHPVALYSDTSIPPTTANFNVNVTTMLFYYPTWRFLV